MLAKKMLIYKDKKEAVSKYRGGLFFNTSVVAKII